MLEKEGEWSISFIPLIILFFVHNAYICESLLIYQTMKKLIFTLLACFLTLGAYAQDYKDSPNYRKSIAVFGGSFSVITPSDVAKAHWAECLGSKITTYGIGGAGFSKTTGEDRWLSVQIDRALAVEKPYDIFIIWASTNDVSRGISLEEQNQEIRNCIEKIRKNVPQAKIMFFSSLPVPLLEYIAEEDIEKGPEWSRGGRRNMKKLPSYVEGQEQVCREMNVPFLNLYTDSGINRWNAVDFFQGDMLHLNNAGYNHIKETQARFIATH